MKVNLVNVVMLSTGIILLYSGIKGYDPRDVLRYGLGGKKPKTFAEKDKGKGTISPPQEKPPSLGGPEYPGDLGLPDPDDKDNVPAVYV